MKDLTGRKCLITGAASGIGRATALAAARAGTRLVLTDIAAVGLAETVELVRAGGGEVLDATPLDVSDYDAVTAWAKRVHDEHGSLDVVMNIAGISAWGTVENLEHRHWRSMVEVNLMGPIHIIENFLPPMVRAGRGGHLVNVSSAAGLIALPWHAAYSAAKFGLCGISEVLRFDLERHGIGVSLVVPGAVRTPLVDTAQIVGVDPDDPRLRRLRADFAGRAATPEQVADRIIAGVRRNRYLVHTSTDIRIAYWFARKFAWPYEQVVRYASRQFSKLLPAQGSSVGR
ncbi:SDR family oxidoreductase [Nocardia sp. CDC159]|uniref:SDR family oxidoreductase n=1 Tax=Nocardia pulmonis TaxID=2951408 RepID=A0A9X2E1S8_9NOCA|nr:MULTISPECIES: SDR family oxidoreductase [Nocardia]MCM6772619.1 SDR family oxidoreductase [Nocardia pulmonis]MCM6786078.1 SDR family oxidoreductase [Nocardia sp. CDC159]